MTRVLAHAHTTWSHDGHLPLDAYVYLARRIDCSVVLLTEHEESGWNDERYEAYKRACAQASTGDVRLVPGLEFSQDGRHVLCYGLDRLPPRPSSIEELAGNVHLQGCILALAHPSKYGWRIPSDILRWVDAVEIWNSKWIYDGAAGPHPESLRLASPKRAVVGQDVHKLKHQSDLVIVTASDNVLADLATGQYSFACRGRTWADRELRKPHATLRRRARRVWMDTVLAGYRSAGRIVSRPTERKQRRVPRPPLAGPSPFVSVILPIRNEASFIGRALASVRAQHYPADRIEVIVADGDSTDGTPELVRRSEPDFDGRLRLIENPDRIVSTGLNAALRIASGEVIVRVDGHCEIPPDFVQRSVEHLSLDCVDCVGGSLDTVGETPMARVIAIAMSSSFGVGGSAFRSSAAVSTLTDSVAFPAWTRRAMQRTGQFDEELVRNQDDEYSYRLRRMGGRILLATDITARYYSRSTIRFLWRQCFGYGFWKVRVLQKHPRQMKGRQFVPAAFVAALLASLLLWPFSSTFQSLALLIVGAYLLAAGFATSRAVRVHGWSVMPWLPAAFATMHVAYGAGSLVGALRFWKYWRSFGHAPIVVGAAPYGEDA
jgi:glycosyltransferase involved in cell wall biosynthesis